MGACIRFPPPPAPVSITIPGGAKLTSMPDNSHDPCGPIDSIFKLTMPAFGAITPSLDIVNFIMVMVEFLMCLLALLGAIMAMFGNPALATVFPLPTIKNTADNEPIAGFAADEDTGIPDVKCALDNAMLVLCRALKLVGLVPQLSMIVTIKDTLNALLALMSCIQAKINSLQDAVALVPGDIGDPLVDQELACAREAMGDFFVHAAGPLVNIVPLLQAVGKAAEPLQQGLPTSVGNIIRLAVNLKLVPFSNDTAGENAKTQFLDLVTQLEQGFAIQIPDFTDISDLSAKMDEIREKLAPIVGAVEQAQKLLEKLENC